MGIHGVMVMVRERPSGTIERIHRQLVSSLKDGTREEKDRLTDQDLRPLGKPHVTVLNKAKNEDEVDVCLSEVMGVFDEMKEPWHHFGQKTGRAVGFELSVTLIIHCFHKLRRTLLIIDGSTSAVRGNHLKRTGSRGKKNTVRMKLRDRHGCSRTRKGAITTSVS